MQYYERPPDNSWMYVCYAYALYVRARALRSVRAGTDLLYS